MQNNVAASKSINETFIFANKTIKAATSTVFNEMEKMRIDYMTKDKMVEVYPKAEKKIVLTNKLLNKIDTLKKILMSDINSPVNETSEDELWSDKLAVKSLFFTNKVGDGLEQSVVKYYSDIMAIDSNIFKEFKDGALKSSFGFNMVKNFTTTFFKDKTVAEAITILSKIQSNIYTTENQTITFLRNQISYYYNYNYSYSAIITQNSSCLLPGQEIEILAGVGSFSAMNKPAISINNIPVEINNEMIALKKIRTPQKPGNYSIPVSIKFMGNEGEPQLIEKNIEYTVFDKNK